MVKCYVIKLFTADVTTTIPILDDAFSKLVLCYLTRY